LARGEVATYLSTPVMMDPASTLLPAPFAAEGVSAYQWACLPCLFAVALLGLYLAGIARRRGMSEAGSWCTTIPDSGTESAAGDTDSSSLPGRMQIMG
jgi:hypothetical protein